MAVNTRRQTLEFLQSLGVSPRKAAEALKHAEQYVYTADAMYRVEMISADRYEVT